MDGFIFQALWAKAETLRGKNKPAHDFIEEILNKYTKKHTNNDLETVSNITHAYMLCTFVLSIMKSKRRLKRYLVDQLNSIRNYLFRSEYDIQTIDKHLPDTPYLKQNYYWTIESFNDVILINSILNRSEQPSNIHIDIKYSFLFNFLHTDKKVVIAEYLKLYCPNENTPILDYLAYDFSKPIPESLKNNLKTHISPIIEIYNSLGLSHSEETN